MPPKFPRSLMPCCLPRKGFWAGPEMGCVITEGSWSPAELTAFLQPGLLCWHWGPPVRTCLLLTQISKPLCQHLRVEQNMALRGPNRFMTDITWKTCSGRPPTYCRGARLRTGTEGCLGLPGVQLAGSAPTHEAVLRAENEEPHSGASQWVEQAAPKGGIQRPGKFKHPGQRVPRVCWGPASW